MNGGVLRVRAPVSFAGFNRIAVVLGIASLPYPLFNPAHQRWTCGSCSILQKQREFAAERPEIDAGSGQQSRERLVCEKEFDFSHSMEAKTQTDPSGKILPTTYNSSRIFPIQSRSLSQRWSISLKGPTRFQRKGPLKSAERSDEAIFNCLP